MFVADGSAYFEIMSDEWTYIADVKEVPVGHAGEFVVAGRIIALYNVEGEYFALDGICPHQGGPLGKGELSGCIVTCPWHGFQFDVRSGEHQTSKQLRQPAFMVKLEGSKIYIHLDPDSA